MYATARLLLPLRFPRRVDQVRVRRQRAQRVSGWVRPAGTLHMSQRQDACGRLDSVGSSPRAPRGVHRACGVTEAGFSAAWHCQLLTAYEPSLCRHAARGSHSPVGSEDECSSALKYLSLCATSPWTGDTRGIPAGCSHRPDTRHCGNHDMHWNAYQGTGDASGDYSPICRLQDHLCRSPASPRLLPMPPPSPLHAPLCGSCAPRLSCARC